MSTEKCGNCGGQAQHKFVCYICHQTCCPLCSNVRYYRDSSRYPQFVRTCNRCGYRSHPDLR